MVDGRIYGLKRRHTQRSNKKSILKHADIANNLAYPICYKFILALPICILKFEDILIVRVFCRCTEEQK